MRWIAEGTWEATSALHCGEPGGNDLGGRDMPVTRTGAGEFFIPAASLTGAARSYAGRRMMEPARYETSDADDRERIEEPDELRHLFGSRQDYASTLVVDDGHIEADGGLAMRDGVRIESKTGLAWEDKDGGAKFDCEVVAAGARFGLRFEFRPPAVVEKDALEKMLSTFALVLEGFAKGEIRLGARTRRGYGAGAVKHWKIRKIATPADYVGWLKRDANAGTEVSWESLGGSSEDKRKYLEIALWLRLETSLLVRSGGSSYGDPDTLHLTERGLAVLPGTSLAGVVRHRCERIVKTLSPAAIPLVEAMFGPLKKEGERVALRASRVRVDEATVYDATLAVHTRVAIDRFTQAALESKLFEEAPLFPLPTSEGHVRGLRIRLEAPRANETSSFEKEAALLLLAVKDLWLGDLAAGGGGGVGRGVFQGLRAEIRSDRFGAPLSMSAKGERLDGVEVDGAAEDWKMLNGWCRQWRTD